MNFAFNDRYVFSGPARYTDILAHDFVNDFLIDICTLALFGGAAFSVIEPLSDFWIIIANAVAQGAHIVAVEEGGQEELGIWIPSPAL